MTTPKLAWQSKLVLLAVIPCIAVELVLQAQWWMSRDLWVTFWALGLSTVLGLLALAARAGMLAAAATGALVTASLMFSTAETPFNPWKTGLVPVLTFLILTTLATRFGRARKEQLGTAEERRGRVASQVCANLGMATLVTLPPAQLWLADHMRSPSLSAAPFSVLGLAALAEAAADTISSEIGQVLGGTPVMLTTFRRVAPGTDGGITLAGTLAGVLAAAVVSSSGTLALHGGTKMFLVSWAGGVFGLLFDSLLGATLERKGWLNNDAVNFLSTAGAAAFSLGMVALLQQGS